MPESGDGEQLDAALGEVWERMRPVIAERVAAIERASFELAQPSPGGQAIESGREAAHKLAGVLGTFGLDRGTELARQLEERLGGSAAGTEADELARLAAELRAIVEGARPGQPPK